MLFSNSPLSIGEGEPGLERHGIGRDVVASPQLGGIEAELVGGEIDQPLDHIGRLGTAVAAIRPHRVGVGEYGGDIGMHRRRAIDPGEGPDVAGEGRHAGLQIGADGGDRLHPHPQEGPVLVERELGFGDVVTGLGVAEKGFRAGRHPFDRPPHELRRQQHQRHLVVDRRLHAEAAADIARDHADPALRYFQDRCQLGAVGVHALQRRVDGVAAVGSVVVANAAARLHGRGGDPVDHEAVLDDVIGPRKRGLGRSLVAEQLNKADIVGTVVPHPRRAPGGRLCGRRHRRQRLVVDRDPLGGVGGVVIRIRHHEGDIVADPAHPVPGQRRVGRPEHASVAQLQTPRHRQIAPAGGLPVSAAEHRQHPRRRLGPARIDRSDPGVGVGRAEHVAERHARQHHVADVAAAALEQPRILETGHALADREFTHRILGADSLRERRYRKAVAGFPPGAAAARH